MDERDLLKLKKEIDAAKAELQTLTGERNYLMKELKETWECQNVKEAKTLVETMESEVEKMKSALEDLLTSIKEKYDV